MDRLHAVTDRIKTLMDAVLTNKSMLWDYTVGSRCKARKGSALAKRRQAAPAAIRGDIDMLLTRVAGLRDEYEDAVKDVASILTEKEMREINNARHLLGVLTQIAGK
jgi:hypothetical protein